MIFYSDFKFEQMVSYLTWFLTRLYKVHKNNDKTAVLLKSHIYFYRIN